VTYKMANQAPLRYLRITAGFILAGLDSLTLLGRFPVRVTNCDWTATQLEHLNAFRRVVEKSWSYTMGLFCWQFNI
jgi:hypothetical protein